MADSKPAPSAEPQIPGYEQDALISKFLEAYRRAHWSVSHSDIKQALKRADLAIVTTAEREMALGTIQCMGAGYKLVPPSDVVTKEERAVLEAMAGATDKDLARGHRGDWTVPVLTAELARRASKGQKT